MNRTPELWAVELDVSREARPEDRDENGEYWAIHIEEDSDGYNHLFVFGSEAEAREEAQGRYHDSRVVRFIRAPESEELKKGSPSAFRERGPDGRTETYKITQSGRFPHNDEKGSFDIGIFCG